MPAAAESAAPTVMMGMSLVPVTVIVTLWLALLLARPLSSLKVMR